MNCIQVPRQIGRQRYQDYKLNSTFSIWNCKINYGDNLPASLQVLESITIRIKDMESRFTNLVGTVFDRPNQAAQESGDIVGHESLISRNFLSIRLGTNAVNFETYR